ncbi:MAG TPA: hypothetical protein VEN81_00205, partial [Planctomycetota bacterium]|nr:hypothetical protein [Planctomycetota bacterium]
MISSILALCLLFQERPPGDSGTPKDAHEGSPAPRTSTDPIERLDDLLQRIDALQAELNELKKSRSPSPAESPSPKTSAPPAPSNAQDQEDEKKKKQLEEEFRKALGQDAAPPRPAPPPPSGVPIGGGAMLKLIDIAFDLLAAGGTSTANEDELRLLQSGGHDPQNRGFTLQNAELTFSGVVDPYLRGDANIVLQIDSAGSTTIELEEAYLTTLEMPFNLQLKAGQFFNAFGRINSTHPHTWDFVDQPVIVGRVLGPDGYRNPGAQVAWLTPLPFFAELTGSVQNSQGDTAPYFRAVPGDVVAGRTLINRPVRSPDDMVYLSRLKTSFDPTDEITLV